MRKNVFLLSIMTMFIFGCSTESVNEIQEESKDLSTQIESLKLIETLNTSREFNDIISNHLAMQRNNGNNEHGLVVVQNGLTLLYLISGPEYSFFVAPDRFQETVTLLPNGRAKFEVNTNAFSVNIRDAVTFEPLYSSVCADGTNNRMRTKVIANYLELVFPTPDGLVTLYFPQEPFQTSSIFRVDAELNDAPLIFNGVDFDCGEYTEEKSLRLWRTQTNNNNENGQDQNQLFDFTLQ
ncbi:globin family protein [Psychroserpens sp. MEBiC05023]